MSEVIEKAAEAVCVWSQDKHHEELWDTACGQVFWLAEDTPSGNDMVFCCYCGRNLIES